MKVNGYHSNRLVLHYYLQVWPGGGPRFVRTSDTGSNTVLMLTAYNGHLSYIPFLEGERDKPDEGCF